MHKMTLKTTTVQMPDLSLIVVRSDQDRQPEIKAAWQKLESRLPSLKGRKFYGVCCREESRTVYYAGLEPLDAEEITRLGLPTLLVKGGKYVRARISDWPKHVDRIGAIFDDLQRTFKTDPDRPVIEHYRSHTELDLLAPLAGEK
jgi:predicted transcriptional regulator YdeE